MASPKYAYILALIVKHKTERRDRVTAPWPEADFDGNNEYESTKKITPNWHAKNAPTHTVSNF